MLKKIDSNKRKNKKIDVFYYSVGMIFLVQILIKIVGLLYNIFLTNNINYSDSGNGIFMSAHQVYILFLVVSIAGIPIAVTKMISSKSKSGKDIEKIMFLNLAFWGVIGIAESIVLIMSSRFIAIHILNVEIVEKILKILAISIPFVNFNSVFRGFLNGIGKTHEGTIIQFIEQLIKVIFTILGIYILRNINLENIENILYIVSYGIMYSIILTFFIFVYKWKKYNNNINNIEATSIRYKHVLKDIFLLTFPITLIGIFGVLNKNVDLVLFKQILKNKFDSNVINEMYGIIVSKVDVLINFPIGLNTALIIPLLSKISNLYSENRIDKIKKSISDCMCLSFAFSMPVTLIFVVYSKEIFGLFYPNASQGYLLLSLGSLLVLLNTILQIISVYYNAIGKSYIIIKSYLIGLIIKIVLNCILLLIEGIYEKAIIISSIVSDIIIIFILINDKNVKKYNIDFFDFKIKDIFFEICILFFINFLLNNSFKILNINSKISFVLMLRN